MTNFEAISARLYPYNVDDNLIKVSCMDESLKDEGEYKLEDKQAIAKAAISILKQLIVLSSESNGGYSLGYDTNMLSKRIHDIAVENDLTDIAEEFNVIPTIEFLSL